jgi:RNA polymerase sigma factor (TIGR02999 family)
MPEPSFTLLLQAIARGEPSADERLLHLVYGDLHRLAQGLLHREPADCTVQATMLVHDAWLGLCRGGTEPAFADRQHFFRAAARAMRNLLVDHARRRQADRRGGGRLRVTLSEAHAVADARDDVTVLALHEALEELERTHPSLCRLVEVRYFAGLTLEAAAEALGRSVATLKREWTYARAWLHERLQRSA